jgi:hypothetical protein
MNKLNLGKITLACVDTLNHDAALNAMHFCLSQCNFHEALFFSDKKYNDPRIKFIPIKALTGKIGEGSYSYFVLKKINVHIKSEYILIVQHDGWILNKNAWTDDFYNYDYIGARWNDHGDRDVGNGGFSLRSKKLHDILANDEIIPGDKYPEDVCIGIITRPYLEHKHNIKIAPANLANKFSCEHDPCDRGCCFGFHYIGAGEFRRKSIEKYGTISMNAPDAPDWENQLRVVGIPEIIISKVKEQMEEYTLEKKYEKAKVTPSDINMFIPKLREYASKCSHVTEFGVRWIVSTWGLLAGSPKKLVSYDIVHPSQHNAKIEEVYGIAKDNNIEYEFNLASSLEAEIEPTDLLFIDTEHTYSHLTKELNLHHKKVSKYIICHDTIAFPDVKIAVDSFVKDNKNWTIKEHLENWPGLIILESNNK